MGACVCVMIGVGNHRGVYGIQGMIDQKKYTEVYNCVGTKILGLSVGNILVPLLGTA